MEAVASPAFEANPGMSDPIIDALMARAIHADAAPLVSPDYPDQMIVRLVTDIPSPYVLRGHTLAEVQAQLPPGLERTEPPVVLTARVVEIWFPG